MSDYPRFNLGVFGQRGCGKTVLLATYFGQRSLAYFQEQHGYYLTSSNVSQRVDLSRLYTKMTSPERRLPQSSYKGTVYPFSFRIDGMSKACFELNWGDYPGEWWRQGSEDLDHETYKERAKMIEFLLTCDSGILLLDGKKILEDQSQVYCLSVLNEFRQEIESQLDEAEQRGLNPTYPEHWIIGITKADLFGPKYSAKDLYNNYLENNIVKAEINAISKRLGKDEFGKNYLLLSSAEISIQEEIKDLNKSFGLDLIAPLVFESALNKLHEKLEYASDKKPKWYEKAWGFFSSSRKYRNENIREAAQKARQEDDSLTMAVSKMMEILDEEKSSRLLYTIG